MSVWFLMWTFELLGYPRRPEARTAEPRPDSLQFNVRHKGFVPDMNGGVLGLEFVRPVTAKLRLILCDIYPRRVNELR
jgi:hypothetical protein